MQQKRFKNLILVLFALGALLYNSWPLGYLLNPTTARYGLASDLATGGQPYNWLFILCDMLVAVTLLTATLLVHGKLGKDRPRALSVTLAGLVVFAVFTATSAVATNGCHNRYLPHVTVCASFGQRLLGPDGIESTLAALGLLVSLVGINVLTRRYQLYGWLKHLAQVMLLVWAASGLWFLWAAANNGNAHLAQYALLVTSGLALLVIGLTINAALEQQQVVRQDQLRKA